MTIPYQKQSDPQVNRGCGAACLSMVYQSFGQDVPQDAIWPLIAKPNRFGSVASAANLMAQHAIGQGLSAVILQARHPLQVLRLCRDSGIRAILNHRLQPGVSTGHFTVLVDVDDDSVVLHDPFFGPAQRISNADLLQLWQPSGANSEIVGNVLVGIAADPPAPSACEFCHTAMPPAIDCARCRKPLSTSPSTLLGCLRDGCIARMWSYVGCPACDYLFNESTKSTGEIPRENPLGKQSDMPPPQNLDKLFAELDRFCAHVLTIPGAAEHADLRMHLGVMQASKDKLKLAQLEDLAYFKTHLDQLSAFAQESKERVAAHNKRKEEIAKPLPPLDGNALGAALLKNLGFK